MVGNRDRHKIRLGGDGIGNIALSLDQAGLGIQCSCLISSSSLRIRSANHILVTKLSCYASV